MAIRRLDGHTTPEVRLLVAPADPCATAPPRRAASLTRRLSLQPSSGGSPCPRTPSRPGHHRHRDRRRPGRPGAAPAPRHPAASGAAPRRRRRRSPSSTTTPTSRVPRPGRRSSTAARRRPAIKIQRQRVPTDQLLPKVLQGASSKTLPDLLFTDNPTLQQVAAHRRADPADRLRHRHRRLLRQHRQGRHLPGQGLRPGARRQRPRPDLQQGPARRRRRRAAENLGRAEGRRGQADQGRQVRPRLLRGPLRGGHLAVPPVLLEQRRRTVPIGLRAGRAGAVSTSRTW